MDERRIPGTVEAFIFSPVHGAGRNDPSFQSSRSWALRARPQYMKIEGLINRAPDSFPSVFEAGPIGDWLRPSAVCWGGACPRCSLAPLTHDGDRHLRPGKQRRGFGASPLHASPFSKQRRRDTEVEKKQVLSLSPRSLRSPRLPAGRQIETISSAREETCG
jgi:hypothetical protein